MAFSWWSYYKSYRQGDEPGMTPKDWFVLAACALAVCGAWLAVYEYFNR
jgi:hypothetical protein